MAFFLSKKQKQQMRDRKRKKKTASSNVTENKEANDTEASKLSMKRPRPTDDDEDEPVVTVSDISEQSTEKSTTPGVVIVPADLSAKDSKKFRKDARRKARAAGHDDDKLKFLVEGEEEKETKRPPKKKKRSFPCINDMLEQDKKEAEERAVVEARAQEEASLSEEYKARYVACDCEMVGIGSDGKQSALARVSLTDWHGKVVMDTFVKVPSRVTDFRTWVSGVTAKHLRSEDAMDEIECRRKVAALLKGKVLVGHALKNDLDALLLQHPKQDIRDTAKFRPYQRHGGNKWRPRKLRDLALQHLGLKIQQQGESHDSVDDAQATMKLFQLKRNTWERELELKEKKHKRK